MQLPNLREMDPKRKRFLLYSAAALVVFIVAGMVFGNAMVNRYQTCLMCHEMTDAVKTWQGSSHEKIACTNCHHKEPGYYGFILGIPHKITDGITHITGEYSLPIKAKERIESKVCQRCHVKWRNVSPSGDLIVPHNKHFEERGIPCVRCHYGVAHGAQLEGKFIRRPAMEICLSCHGGGQKSAATYYAPTLTCKNCHTEKAVPDSHKDKSWFAMHSKVATDPSHPDHDCRKCHGWTPYFCSKCHAKRPSTHYGGVKWRTYHAERARVNKSGCLVCHNAENFCYRCHDPFKDVER
ncbi:MAG: cytochrome c3 family protein [Actinomycetota bacterium]|nr:cytochrome c3 family protein [Actinomycetota bacterium]